MTYKNQRKTIRVRELFDDAEQHRGDISDEAESFLDDIEDKLKFCEDEGLDSITLTDKQFEWLEALADWDNQRSDFYD